MSLINDALKRAKQAQQKHLPAPEPPSPLRPILATRANTPSLAVLWPLVLFMLAVVGGVAFWLAVRPNDSLQTAPAVAYANSQSPPPMAKSQTDPSASFQKPITPSSGQAVATALAPRPEATASAVAHNRALNESPPSPPITEATAGQSPTPVTTTSTQPAAKSVAPGVALTQPPVSEPASVVANQMPPLPKLQGIFYRPGRPSAVLNGKTLVIGGMSGEYRVAAIDQATVTLIRAGQTNVLSLPE